MGRKSHWTLKRSLMQAQSSEYSLPSQRKSHFLVDIFARSRPLPYDCIVKLRFPEVESILAEERERFEI